MNSLSEGEVTVTALLQAYWERLVGDISSTEHLKKLLIEISALYEQVVEHITKNYILFCQDQQSKEFREVILQDNKWVKPLLNKLEHDFDKKLVTVCNTLNLSTVTGDLSCRKLRTSVLESKISRELRSNEEELLLRYTDILGQLHLCPPHEVSYSALHKSMSNSDHMIRKNAWQEINRRKAQYVEEIENIFSKLIECRHAISSSSGFDNFVQYKFHTYDRTDYTESDCACFYEQVRKYIVPIKSDLESVKSRSLKVSRLMPWDSLILPTAKDPVSYETPEELLVLIEDVFHKIDPGIADILRRLNCEGMFDLYPRPSKAPGAFTSLLPYSQRAFVFMNLGNGHRDLVDFVHELGHAVHLVMASSQEIAYNKYPSREISEFVSLTFELIVMQYWGLIYKDAEIVRATKWNQLMEVVYVITSAAMIDEFQTWCYRNPSHTVIQRRSKFLELAANYNGTMCIQGFDEEMCNQWRFLPHMFRFPLYYIEYGIAQIGAIYMWQRYCRDPQTTIDLLKQCMREGCRVSTRDIFAIAGLEFPEMMKNLGGLAHILRLEATKLDIPMGG